MKKAKKLVWKASKTSYFKIYTTSLAKGKLKKIMLKKFLEQPPNKNLEEKDFSNAFLKDLFIRYNTPIPSSAAVERIVFLGKGYFESETLPNDRQIF